MIDLIFLWDEVVSLWKINWYDSVMCQWDMFLNARRCVKVELVEWLKVVSTVLSRTSSGMNSYWTTASQRWEYVFSHWVKARSHWHKHESGWLCMGYSKHGFACITGSLGVLDNLKYEQFLCKLLFSTWKQQKRTPESFDVNNCIVIMVQWCTWHNVTVYNIVQPLPTHARQPILALILVCMWTRPYTCL